VLIELERNEEFRIISELDGVITGLGLKVCHPRTSTSNSRSTITPGCSPMPSTYSAWLSTWFRRPS
jgi:hypothetical protein